MPLLGWGGVGHAGGWGDFLLAFLIRVLPAWLAGWEGDGPVATMLCGAAACCGGC